MKHHQSPPFVHGKPVERNLILLKLGQLALLSVVVVLCSDSVCVQDSTSFIEVRNPRKLSANRIPCERIALGKVGDYKPTIAVLPGGELLLSMFSSRRLDTGKVAEQTVLYRSADGGRTWSAREEPDIAGREPALSVTRNGTVLLTTHLTGPDVRNKDGYTHSYLHRSENGGRIWTSIRVEPKAFRPRTKGLLTRNVLQMADGTLILGVSEHLIKTAGLSSGAARTTERRGPSDTKPHSTKCPGIIPTHCLEKLTCGSLDRVGCLRFCESARETPGRWPARKIRAATISQSG